VIQPLPVEFVVAEAERQNLDALYRSLRGTMVKALQEREKERKVKTHAVRAVQSLCEKEAWVLGARRRKIRVLHDIVLAFRKRHALVHTMQEMAVWMKEKIQKKKGTLKAAGGEGEAESEKEMEESEEEEEEEDSEEEEEELVLKFEDEPLEANEVVLTPEGAEGVIEGIRRGNVVVKTDAGLETFKLEEVKRKHIAPPGYVKPVPKTRAGGRGRGAGGAAAIVNKDLLDSWEALEERMVKVEKDAERGMRDKLEILYQESGLEQQLHRGAGNVEPEEMDAHPFSAGGSSSAGFGGGGGSGLRAKRRGEGCASVRPILFMSAPRGVVPFEVPLLVSPVVDLPDHTLAICHVTFDARKEGGREGGEALTVAERVASARARTFSKGFQAWEEEKREHSTLKAEVVKLETIVRRQKQQTDEITRWLNVDSSGPTATKLKNQLACLEGDMHNLRFRHRIECQIANIPVPEGEEFLLPSGVLKSVDLPAMLHEAAELGAGLEEEDEEEQEEQEKRRRLAEEEAEEEAEILAAQKEEEMEGEEGGEGGGGAPPGHMRSRSSSLRGRGAGGIMVEDLVDAYEADAVDALLASSGGGITRTTRSRSAGSGSGGRGGGGRRGEEGGVGTGTDDTGGEMDDDDDDDEEEDDEEYQDEDDDEEEEDEDGDEEGDPDMEAAEALLASVRGPGLMAMRAESEEGYGGDEISSQKSASVEEMEGEGGGRRGGAGGGGRGGSTRGSRRRTAPPSTSSSDNGGCSGGGGGKRGGGAAGKLRAAAAASGRRKSSGRALMEEEEESDEGASVTSCQSGGINNKRSVENILSLPSAAPMEGEDGGGGEEAAVKGKGSAAKAKRRKR